MAMHKRLALAVALVTSIWVQPSHGDDVWAVVAFINHGEREPVVNAPSISLTPEGAQQMLRQGKAFRARYLTDLSDSDYDHIGAARLHNINADMIDNQVLDITSQSDDYVNGGAMAFLQGLYPPSFEAFRDNREEIDMARDYTKSGDNITDFPLNGYQYPNIRTLGMLDPTSTSIQGNLRCSAWESEIRRNLSRDPNLEELYDATLSFYQGLFSTSPMQGTINLEGANLWNAYELYDFVSYEYVHNETVNEGLTNATELLATMNSWATTMERAKNAYINGTADSDDVEEKAKLYSIAGRTLSSRIALQFISNVKRNGDRDKMALMFGSHEPIVAFIAMAGLLDEESVSQGPFSLLPEPGAAMVFELYGEDAQNPEVMPSFDDLMVRFFYRASADADEDFVLYPLWGIDPENGTVPFSTFVQVMQDFGVSASEWCNICGPNPAPWCANSYYYDDERSCKKEMSAATAGGLGAFFALAVVLLGWIFWRLLQRKMNKENQQPANAAPSPSTAAAGGFKGPEKKAGDRDVAVTGNGIHHERVGSWEMKGATTVPAVAAVGVTTKDSTRVTASQRRRSFDDDDDDAISVMGATPVKAHESV
ncbi:histidine phosphatase superfamily [Thelonectria olida]|uniref:Histidine phosphatase superfamily n=1 Tax=Thelonectria olida TaxID=1576542 RepID=A0A9P8VZ38_9HYPO|nr:histidine phosphatase superfamily [Thelonectria olida]